MEEVVGKSSIGQCISIYLDVSMIWLNPECSEMGAVIILSPVGQWDYFTEKSLVYLISYSLSFSQEVAHQPVFAWVLRNSG